MIVNQNKLQRSKSMKQIESKKRFSSYFAMNKTEEIAQKQSSERHVLQNHHTT